MICLIKKTELCADLVFFERNMSSRNILLSVGQITCIGGSLWQIEW